MKHPWLLPSLLLLCSLAGQTAEPPSDSLPPKENFHLFLLAGQSNMAGRGKSDTAAQTAHPRVFSLRKNLEWAPAVDPLHWDKPSAGTGLGKPFAEALAEKFPSLAIGLIPAACGGSPVSAWKPGVFFSQTKSNPYDDALTRTRKALEKGSLKAILWHQGESDCNATNAPEYEKNLEALIQKFRTEFQQPELPFLIGQLGQFPQKPWNAETGVVDAAHQSLARRIKNVRFIPLPNPVSIGDHLHFDTPTLRVFGKAYADAYLDVIGAPKP
jgi:hypothetical protein